MIEKQKIIPNFFQCPNAIVDELIQHVTGAELKCYLVIIRKTTGWRKVQDRISISQFINLTGLSNRSVIDACNKLFSLGLIEIKRSESGEKTFSLVDVDSFDLPSEKTSPREKTSQQPMKKVHSPYEEISQVASEKTSHTKDTITKDTIQKTIKDICADVASDDQREPSKAVKPKKPKANTEQSEANKATWSAYATAYENRYKTAPIRNAQINGMIAKFVKSVPQDEAPLIARYYINMNTQFYVQKLHPVKLLLADADAIRTQWATNRTVSATAARQADQFQAAKSAVDGAAERYARRHSLNTNGDALEGECKHV